jgi:hypothetical protein
MKSRQRYPRFLPVTEKTLKRRTRTGDVLAAFIDTTLTLSFAFGSQEVDGHPN